MTESAIEKQLTRRVADMLGIDPGAVDAQVSLHDLGLDSMRMVEILLFIENQFGIVLVDAHLAPEDLHSVAAIARTVERLATV